MDALKKTPLALATAPSGTNKAKEDATGLTRKQKKNRRKNNSRRKRNKPQPWIDNYWRRGGWYQTFTREEQTQAQQQPFKSDALATLIKRATSPVQIDTIDAILEKLANKLTCETDDATVK